MNDTSHEPESLAGQQAIADEVPLCLHCLEAVSVLDHYCPHCGEAVGQYTPNIPFVNIGFQVSFWDRLLGRLWEGKEEGRGARLIALVLIIFAAPIMLAVLPFVVLAKLLSRQK
jgi:hypothetical protein